MTDMTQQEWTYKPDYFQYIHSRFLATAIKDWPRYFQQCFKHTSKGGYVEIVEHPLDHLDCDDDTLEGSKLNEYLTKFANCLSKTGIKVDINVDFFKQGLEEAGFVNLQVYATRVPWGMIRLTPFDKLLY